MGKEKAKNITSLHVLDDVRVDGALEAVAAASVLACCIALDTHAGGGAVGAGALAVRIGLGERALYGFVLGGQEDDFAVGGLGHGLHCLEVADLHGWRTGEDVG